MNTNSPATTRAGNSGPLAYSLNPTALTSRIHRVLIELRVLMRALDSGVTPEALAASRGRPMQLNKLWCNSRETPAGVSTDNPSEPHAPSPKS